MNIIFLKLFIKNFLNFVLKKFNLRLTTFSHFNKLSLNAKSSFDFTFLSTVKKNKEQLFKTLKYMPMSKSQLRQDLFVLNQLNFKKKGFFVEFGAADGVHCSNTFLLEKKFKWKGILSEPGRIYHQKLSLCRKCKIEKKIIWKDSISELLFNETLDPFASTIDKFSFKDINKLSRVQSNNKYKIKTISLNDLLKKYGAPKIVDYLSIDTEGSEFDILNAFNFKKYKFRVITVEVFSNKKKIHTLLSKNGYLQVFSHISGFDNWYINKSVIK
jgi:FkbM family methyltransferase